MRCRTLSRIVGCACDHRADPHCAMSACENRIGDDGMRLVVEADTEYNQQHCHHMVDKACPWAHNRALALALDSRSSAYHTAVDASYSVGTH